MRRSAHARQETSAAFNEPPHQESTPMNSTHRAFARPGLLLAVMSAEGTATILLTAEPVHAPQRGIGQYGPGRVQYYGPRLACPRAKIPLADGRLVDLADLRPGTRLQDGCDLRGVAWAGVNLAGVDFHSCDLRGADLR